jgi:hypothetical protein
MPDDADTFAAKPAKAPDDRSIVAEFAIASEGNKARDQAGDVVEAVWALRMSGDLSFLPGREVGIEILQCQRGF